MASEKRPRIRRKNVDAILRFLPVISAEGFCFSEYRPVQLSDDEDDEGKVILSQVYTDFVRAVRDNTTELTESLKAWWDTPEARSLLTSVEAVGAADEYELMMLLALHVKTDRYVKGHLQEALSSGYIVPILQRLAVLRDLERKSSGAVKVRASAD